MKNNKILLVGEWYSSNLGDGLICEIVEKQLLKIYNNPIIIRQDISNREGWKNEKISKVHTNPIVRILKKSFNFIGIDFYLLKLLYIELQKRTMYRNIKQSDFNFVFFAGGQLFKDTFILSILKIVKIAEKKEAKIIFNSVGYGDIKNNYLKLKLKKLLQNKAIISITMRDHVSEFNRIFNSNAIFNPDPGIFASDFYQMNILGTQKTLGLGVMYLHNYNKKILINFWISLIRLLEKRRIPWQIFVNGDSADFEFANEILSILGLNSYNFELLKLRPESPTDLVHTISSFFMIVSFRLHSHIIANSFHIPSIAISWDNKVNSFFELVNHRDRVFKLNMNVIEVFNKINEILEERIEESEILLLIKHKNIYLSNFSNFEFFKEEK